MSSSHCLTRKVCVYLCIVCVCVLMGCVYTHTHLSQPLTLFHAGNPAQVLEVQSSLNAVKVNTQKWFLILN